MPDATRLRITLLDLDPAPWREIDVPLAMSFKGLHDAIQAAFLWEGTHLWEFTLDNVRYGAPSDHGPDDPPVEKAGAARLTMLAESEARSFLYIYDFGDYWRHRIEVRDIFTAEPDALLPRFVAGRWRRPPEDVGGPPGFEMFLEALADPKHPEHDDLRDWHGGPFEADDIEEEVIRIQIKRLAKARRSKR